MAEPMSGQKSKPPDNIFQGCGIQSHNEFGAILLNKILFTWLQPNYEPIWKYKWKTYDHVKEDVFFILIKAFFNSYPD